MLLEVLIIRSAIGIVKITLVMKAENWSSNFTTWGLHQEINELTRILNNSSSCIGFIFNSQLNLLIESSVHPPIHPSCHHQIIGAKFKLGTIYLSPFNREMWHYQKVNIDLNIHGINEFDCKKSIFQY